MTAPTHPEGDQPLDLEVLEMAKLALRRIQHAMGCEYPEGCSCGASSQNARAQEIHNRLHALLLRLRSLREPSGQAAFNLHAHLAHQAAWSEKTFGPGSRAKGVVDHIRKELNEIEADPGDLKEWIDVVILALDGAWRSGASPSEIIAALVAKQAKNEARAWPDWRTQDPNKAIEHDRSKDGPRGGGESPGAGLVDSKIFTIKSPGLYRTRSGKEVWVSVNTDVDADRFPWVHGGENDGASVDPHGFVWKSFRKDSDDIIAGPIPPPPPRSRPPKPRQDRRRGKDEFGTLADHL